ncbi:putative O-methyltransferase [Candidatus Endolissoclinum faulkneri L5]|uniref:Putative O-methyltransferase n=1 Tax=Candidatus Endolissoclinum faulkneri L5 TaxID=1401328 RepID=V9TS61_9PROT|nr:methyltransferase [Candidatus Endolissoclinum faulkneri]AHC73421.1 putative O-methyltransferase [Candidatus Endolissoclinum faulkneri L5]
MIDTTKVETIESFLLNKRVRLVQPKNGYRVAIDSVLLAAAVPARTGDKVVDLGCGACAVCACIAERVNGVEVIGVERDPAMADMARRTMSANGLTGRIETNDLTNLPCTWETGQIDHVVANPPYMPTNRGYPSPNTKRSTSRVEIWARLADWIIVAQRCLRHKGTITLINRADRLNEILSTLTHGFGSIVVFPLFPKAGRDARRVLVQAVRSSRAPMRLTSGLLLHEPNGNYTSKVEAILRGAPINL